MKFALSVLVLSLVAVGVGLVMADEDETMEWPVTLGLVAFAIAGETLRSWLRHRHPPPID